MWCPMCKSEYRENHVDCSECGAPLVKELPQAPLTELQQKSGDLSVFALNPALLTTVSDDFEFVTLEAFLQEMDIPCMKKHKGSGSYMAIAMGKSIYGMEVYVPSEKLEEAQEVLRSMSHFSEIFLEQE